MRLQAIPSIARLTIREALRHRIVAVFAFLILAVMVGVPLILKGDGTALGRARLMLGYTPGAAFCLLAVANLWAGCALFSGDLAAGRLTPTLVKPVPAWQLLTGKWLGLLVLDLFILAGIYGLTGVQIAGTLHRDPDETAVMRTARELVKPLLPDLDTQIDYYFALNRGTARTPDELRDLRRRLRREIPYQTAALPHGQEWEWIFALNRPPDPSRPLWLRFQFDTDAYTRAIVKADCRLTGDKSGASVDFTLDDFSTRQFEVPLAVETFADEMRFTLRMRHAGDETTGPLMLQPRQGLDLLAPRAPLAVNMVRAALVHFSLLAMLAALGVAAGALFSAPVAVFCATGLLLATMTAAFVADDPYAPPDAHEQETTGRAPRALLTSLAFSTSRLLVEAARPAMEPAPLRQLAAAELIPARTLRRSLWFNALLLPACCGLAGAFALRLRDITT